MLDATWSLDAQLRRLAAFDRPPRLQGCLLGWPPLASELPALLARSLDLQGLHGENATVRASDSGGADEGGEPWDGWAVEPLGR